jgi:hypothetical protein
MNDIYRNGCLVGMAKTAIRLNSQSGILIHGVGGRLISSALSKYNSGEHQI